MTMVAAVGYVAYELSETGLGAETAAVLSSFAIGLSGNLYQWLSESLGSNLCMGFS